MVKLPLNHLCCPIRHPSLVLTFFTHGPFLSFFFFPSFLVPFYPLPVLLASDHRQNRSMIAQKQRREKKEKKTNLILFPHGKQAGWSSPPARARPRYISVLSIQPPHTLPQPRVGVEAGLPRGVRVGNSHPHVASVLFVGSR